jgi:hypothetical protein
MVSQSFHRRGSPSSPRVGGQALWVCFPLNPDRSSRPGRCGQVVLILPSPAKRSSHRNTRCGPRRLDHPRVATISPPNRVSSDSSPSGPSTSRSTIPPSGPSRRPTPASGWRPKIARRPSSVGRVAPQPSPIGSLPVAGTVLPSFPSRAPSGWRTTGQRPRDRSSSAVSSGVRSFLIGPPFRAAGPRRSDQGRGGHPAAVGAGACRRTARRA